MIFSDIDPDPVSAFICTFLLKLYKKNVGECPNVSFCGLLPVPV
jgi:hypothetical protein